MRFRQAGNHAHRRLSVLLRVQQLQGTLAPKFWRLLRVLLVRRGEVPAHSGTGLMLRVSFPGAGYNLFCDDLNVGFQAMRSD